jgi:hypothetical protein
MSLEFLGSNPSTPGSILSTRAKTLGYAASLRATCRFKTINKYGCCARKLT